jgi:hypothetical protein
VFGDTDFPDAVKNEDTARLYAATLSELPSVLILSFRSATELPIAFTAAIAIC